MILLAWFKVGFVEEELLDKLSFLDIEVYNIFDYMLITNQNQIIQDFNQLLLHWCKI